MFLSYDEGKTWPVQKVLTKDFFAYAVLVGLSDGSIGCLYEAENYKHDVRPIHAAMADGQ